VLDRMLELGLNNFGNIGGFNFALSGPTEYPNCLVEVAFLSNAEDEQKILDEKFHRQVADKIYEGIRDWLRSR
jgi:N-acetylmuramoyl-L-alanine amidase